MNTEAIQHPSEGSLTIEEIVQRFGNDLPSWLLRFGVLPADVPDLRQDVLVRVWLERLSIPRETRAARLAMFKLARETVKPHRRLMARRARHVADVDPAGLSAPGSEEEREALWVDLLEAIDALGEPYRTVVMECDIAGRSRKEVADKLRLNESTVRWYLARGRVKVRARLSGATNEERAALLFPFLPLVSDEYSRAVMAAIYSAEGRIPVPGPAGCAPFAGGPREPPPPPPPPPTPPPSFPWLAGPVDPSLSNAAGWIGFAAAAAVVLWLLLLPRGTVDFARVGLWVPPVPGVGGGVGAMSSPPLEELSAETTQPHAQRPSSPPKASALAPPNSRRSPVKGPGLTEDASARVGDAWDLRARRISFQKN